jgi:hypothetical protein
LSLNSFQQLQVTAKKPVYKENSEDEEEEEERPAKKKKREVPVSLPVHSVTRVTEMPP